MAKKKITQKTFIDSPVLGDSSELPDVDVRKNYPHLFATIDDEKIEQAEQPQTEVKSKEGENTLWMDFILLAEESRKEKKKAEAQVWIDEDLKSKIEMLKCAGIRLPIKHILNGMLRAFFKANNKEADKLLKKKIKL